MKKVTPGYIKASHPGGNRPDLGFKVCADDERVGGSADGKETHAHHGAGVVRAHTEHTKHQLRSE